MLKLILINDDDCTYWGIKPGISEEDPNTLWYFDGSDWCQATATVPSFPLDPQCLVHCPDGTLYAIHSDNKVYIATPEDISMSTQEECSATVTFSAVVPGQDDPDFTKVIKSSTGNKLFGISPDFKLWHHTPNGWVFTDRTFAHTTVEGGCVFLHQPDGTIIKVDPSCTGNGEEEQQPS